MPLLVSARSEKGLPAADAEPVLLRQLPVASRWRQRPVAPVPGVADDWAGAPTQPGGCWAAFAGRHWPLGPICGQVGAGIAMRLMQLPSGARGQPALGGCTRPPSATLTAGAATTSTVAGGDQSPLPLLVRRRACT